MSPRLRLALLVAGLVALFAVFGLNGAVSRAEVRGLVAPAGAWAGPLYVLVAAALGAALVPGPLLAAVSGVLFGTWWGCAISLASAVLSALLAQAVGRAVGRPGALAVGGERLEALEGWLRRRGLGAVVVQRLAPAIPDAPVNYAAGLVGMRPVHLAAGTAIGAAPRALAYTALGDSVGDLASPAGLAALALLVVTSLAGAVLATRAVRRAAAHAGRARCAGRGTHRRHGVAAPGSSVAPARGESERAHAMRGQDRSVLDAPPVGPASAAS